MQFKTSSAIGLILALSLPSMASAQSNTNFEDAIVQGNQIDDAIRDQQQLDQQVRTDENAIDGESSIYILNKNEIFFTGATTGIGFSSNPIRTFDDLGDSFSFNTAASVGLQTKLAEKLDFGFQVTASSVDYFDEIGPSSRNISSSINIGTQIAGTALYIGGNVFCGVNFDEDFESPTEFIGGSINIGAGIPIGKKTLLRPGISVTRQYSSTSENNSTSGTAVLGVTHILLPKLAVAANLNVTRTWFDNFFEDVTFVARRDTQYGVSVSSNYQISNNFSLNGNVGYDKRDSSFFISEFDSFDAALFVSARLSF